jgi:hypothetical protein
MDTFTSMTITGTGGPKGTLSADDIGGDKALFMTMLGLVYLARTEAPAGFAATVEAAVGFKCVVADAQPDKLTLKNGETGNFTVTVRGLDDHQPLPSTATSRVYSGKLTLTPVAKDLLGPPSGTVFHATSGGGQSVAEVVLYSRRGRAPTLKIPISEPTYPARFDGMWTTVFTQASSLGWTETVHGTASYVRDPASPHQADGELFVVYKVQSASVDWKVEGSGNPSGQCLNTFSGFGTDQATFDPPVTAQLTLEDTRSSPYATGSAAQPFAYSIAANGDGANPPLYDDTHTGTPPPGCGGSGDGYVTQTGIYTDYLETGWPGNYGLNQASDPPVQITSNATHLTGHYSGPDATHTLHVEEDWSFIGSG